jgi:hypothetical protein
VTLAVIPTIKPDLKIPMTRAIEHIDECDSILIIMQKREGGMLWYAPDEGRIETASFMATSFLHWLHSRKEDD